MITLKQKFTDLFKKNGYYILAALCIVALAAAIGIISTNTSPKDDAENAAGFTDAQTEEYAENTEEYSQDEVAANSGSDDIDGYNADEIQDIVTQIEESKALETGSDDSETSSNAVSDTDPDTQSQAANAAVTGNAFDESQTLAWPLSGTILMDYSMNTTTYYKTLDQYKCNPGILIGADINSEVRCSYSGTVESIRGDSEHGQMVTVNMGNDFRAVYGQLKDIAVSEGEYIAAGNLIGHVAAPTRYYTEEGSHLYFELTKDEIPTDPKLFLQ